MRLYKVEYEAETEHRTYISLSEYLLAEDLKDAMIRAKKLAEIEGWDLQSVEEMEKGEVHLVIPRSA